MEEHHDVVVTDRGGSGFSMGMIAGILIAILIVAILIWGFLLGGFNGNKGSGNPGGGGNNPVPTLPAAP